MNGDVLKFVAQGPLSKTTKGERVLSNAVRDSRVYLKSNFLQFHDESFLQRCDVRYLCIVSNKSLACVAFISEIPLTVSTDKRRRRVAFLQ